MNATTHKPGAVSLMRIHWLEFINECRRSFRTPSYYLPTLLFPLCFFLMFAVILGKGSASAAPYMLANYGVFGSAMAALFGVGLGIASERESGLMRLRRVMPMPMSAVLLAKLGMAMLFALIISLLMMILTLLFTQATLTLAQSLRLLAVHTLGALPFAALGVFLGSLAGANGAVAIINLVFLPMAFLSGLWMPLSMLPAWVADAAPLWPLYHLAQLALEALNLGSEKSVWLHAGGLLLTTLLFALPAIRRLHMR
ncbi:ABC transporter permease [Lysobacteraceae bacterium NML95-0200]|nr:ABC transporter permease [Xanthomonadaceae bacterium NML95-0200]